MSGGKAKNRLIAVALGIGMLAGAATPALGRTNNCEERVRKAEEQLRDAEHKHGEHSKQAQHRRQQLEQLRDRCGAAHNRNHDRDHDRH